MAKPAPLGLRLPEAFLMFMDTPALHDRIRSATDCFLDLCPEPIRSPLGGGWLIHFLADSQGWLFWYLYLTADGSDHAVVAAPDYYSTELEWSGEDGDSDVEDEECDSEERTRQLSVTAPNRSRRSCAASGYKTRSASPSA